MGDEIMIRLEARFLSKNYNERRSDEALQIWQTSKASAKGPRSRTEFGILELPKLYQNTRGLTVKWNDIEKTTKTICLFIRTGLVKTRILVGDPALVVKPQPSPIHHTRKLPDEIRSEPLINLKTSFTKQEFKIIMKLLIGILYLIEEVKKLLLR